jgi:hypothetical protein
VAGLGETLDRWPDPFQLFSKDSAATIALMRRPLAISTVLGLVVLTVATSLANAQAKDAPQKEVPPDVPDSIQAPAGEEVVLYTHATGSQIYTCQAAADGKFNWALN